VSCQLAMYCATISTALSYHPFPQETTRHKANGTSTRLPSPTAVAVGTEACHCQGPQAEAWCRLNSKLDSLAELISLQHHTGPHEALAHDAAIAMISWLFGQPSNDYSPRGHLYTRAQLPGFPASQRDSHDRWAAPPWRESPQRVIVPWPLPSSHGERLLPAPNLAAYFGQTMSVVYSLLCTIFCACFIWQQHHASPAEQTSTR
jgi:hypothetical protein